LNDLIAATLILFLLAWNEQPQQHALLFMSAFLAGLGLTNHQTIVLLGRHLVLSFAATLDIARAPNASVGRGCLNFRRTASVMLTSRGLLLIIPLIIGVTSRRSRI